MSEWFSRRLAEQGIIKEEEREIYRYGLSNGMVILLNLFTTLLIGIFSGHLLSAALFTLFFMLLRSYSGVLLPGIQCSPADSGLYLRSYDEDTSRACSSNPACGISSYIYFKSDGFTKAETGCRRKAAFREEGKTDSVCRTGGVWTALWTTIL